MDEQGDWIEYRRLILTELKALNESSDKHSLSLVEINKSIVEIKTGLNEHMSRTAAAELRIESLQTAIDPLVKMTWLAGLFAKIASGVAMVIGSLWGLTEIFKNIGKH